MHWKDFLYFQRRSKTAVLALLILIVLTLILNLFLTSRNSSDVILRQNDSLVREFEQFRKTLKEREPLSAGRDEKRNGSGNDNRLSIREGEVSAAGRSPDRNGAARESASVRNESPASRNGEGLASRAAYPAIEKLSAGETISLNESDTTEWKKLPGIGSVYASRIVKYRNLLGGFVRVDQLLEVYGVDNALFARISSYIEPDGNIRKLQINKADFSALLRHPYLNYKQVQAITGLRRRRGDIVSIRELSMLGEFTKDDIFRLEPYLEF